MSGQAPLTVACICSDKWEDDTFYEYERLSNDQFRFELAVSPSVLMRADYVVLASRDLAPGYTDPSLKLDVERIMACALESAAISARLGCSPILEMALSRGQVLRVFRSRKPRNSSEAREQAMVWIEMFALPGDRPLNFREAKQWLNGAGFPDAVRDVDDLQSLAEGEMDLDPLGETVARGASFGRLVRWIDEMKRLRTDQGKARGLDMAIHAGPPAGPGLVLTSAVEAFLCNDLNAAKAMAFYNARNFPTHVETWQMLAQLAARGFPFDQKLAQVGEALALKYSRDAQGFPYDAYTDGFHYGRLMARQDFPEFLALAKRRLELMTRDQPQALKTYMLRAAALEGLGEDGPEFETSVRQAIGLCGREQTDCEMFCALGRYFLRAGDERRAVRYLKQGGWAGVETLLEYLSKANRDAEFKAALRWALHKRFALAPAGSDSVRKRAIEAFAQEDPKLAFFAFAEMNQTPMAEEARFFQAILTRCGEADLARFEKTMRQARVNFFSPTRADFYANLVDDELRRRRGEGPRAGVVLYSNDDERRVWEMLEKTRQTNRP